MGGGKSELGVGSLHFSAMTTTLKRIVIWLDGAFSKDLIYW